MVTSACSKKATFSACVRRDEGADDRVELGGVLHALGVGAIARIVDQLRAADGAQRALGHLLRGGRDSAT
jgi:hypothetical protein